MTRRLSPELEVFLVIARTGSLRAAAAELGASPSTVSHALKRLETQIGVTLFARTTRSIELTDAGRELLHGAAPAMSRLADAIDAARNVGESRAGTVRLTAPWSAYRLVLLPKLGALREQAPTLELDLSLSEELVDVVAEGFHAGIRLGDRLAPGMIARRLTPPLRASFFASPDYLARRGRPAHPRDLHQHACIRWRFPTSRRLFEWRFEENGEDFTVDPKAVLVVDGLQPLVEAALDGHGIAFGLRDVVAPEVAQGRLETVLDDYARTHPPFYIYFPPQHQQYSPLRRLLDLLTASTQEAI